MKLHAARSVIDLDEVLPLDGDSRFEMLYADGRLNLEIFYEKDDAPGECKRTIGFLGARYFIKTPFPGYSFFSEGRDISLLNSLVEYGQSELLAMVAAAPGGESLRHYRLFLHSSKVAIHVVAQSCEMLDEVLVDRQLV